MMILQTLLLILLFVRHPKSRGSLPPKGNPAPAPSIESGEPCSGDRQQMETLQTLRQTHYLERRSFL